MNLTYCSSTYPSLYRDSWILYETYLLHNMLIQRIVHKCLLHAYILTTRRNVYVATHPITSLY